MFRSAASLVIWTLIFGQALAGVTFLHDDAYLVCDMGCDGDMYCGKNKVIKPTTTPTCGKGKHACKRGLPIAYATVDPAPTETTETKGSLWERMIPGSKDEPAKDATTKGGAAIDKPAVSKTTARKTGTGKTATSKTTTGKNAASKASTSKASTSKASASKASASKASASKASASKASASKASTSKISVSMISTSKTSASKTTTKKASISKTSTSTAGMSKTTAAKPGKGKPGKGKPGKGKPGKGETTNDEDSDNEAPADETLEETSGDETIEDDGAEDAEDADAEDEDANSEDENAEDEATELDILKLNTTTLGAKAYGDDLDQFMVAQVRWAKKHGNLVAHRKHGTAYSSVARIFHNEPFTVAVQDLFGCTSVVAVSELGCFMSHHWEKPSFQNASVFRDQVITPLSDPEISRKMPALAPLAVEGERFHKSQSPEVFIITPRSRTRGKKLEYPMLVERLAGKLDDMFSGKVSIRIVQYNTILDELDPAKFSLARGKVSLMYNPGDFFTRDPDRPGKWIQRAATKLYVEGRELAGHTWTASPDQKIVPPQPRNKKHKEHHHGHHLIDYWTYRHREFGSPYRRRRAVDVPQA